MTLKSLIPVGRERAVAHPESNPFATLQQEIDRLFDVFTRNFSGFPDRDVMPSRISVRPTRKSKSSPNCRGWKKRMFS